MKDTKIY